MQLCLTACMPVWISRTRRRRACLHGNMMAWLVISTHLASLLSVGPFFPPQRNGAEPLTGAGHCRLRELRSWARQGEGNQCRVGDWCSSVVDLHAATPIVIWIQVERICLLVTTPALADHFSTVFAAAGQQWARAIQGGGRGGGGSLQAGRQRPGGL